MEMLLMKLCLGGGVVFALLTIRQIRISQDPKRSSN